MGQGREEVRGRGLGVLEKQPVDVSGDRLGADTAVGDSRDETAEMAGGQHAGHEAAAVWLGVGVERLGERLLELVAKLGGDLAAVGAVEGEG
jgi:hypothetical protein